MKRTLSRKKKENNKNTQKKLACVFHLKKNYKERLNSKKKILRIRIRNPLKVQM
jgi:hypothetical protein